MSKLLDFLRGSRDSRIGRVQLFPAIDVDQLIKELEVDEKGLEAGKAGQPGPTDEQPDSNEAAILLAFERQARKGREEYEEGQSIYESRIRRAVITGTEQIAIEAAGQNALADLKAAIVNDQNHLHLLRQEVAERELEFRAFRERHHLHRPPRLASRRAEFLGYGFLILFLILESFLNGTFFARGSESGLIGGVLQAFVLSLLNVGVGFSYALILLPLLFDRRSALKVAGVAGIIGFVAWVGLLNLAIGHFRDLYVVAEGTVPMKAVVDRFATRPLLPDDTNSAVLALLGVGLSMLAAADGAFLRDLYPGYGRVARERQQAIADYADGKAECLRRLMRRRDRATGEMTDALEGIRNAEYEVQVSAEGRSKLHHAYVEWLEDVANAYERLVQRYREFNKRGRTLPPPPLYARPIPRPSSLRAFSLETIPESDDDVRQSTTDRIAGYIKAINQQVESALPQYRTIEQLTERENHAVS